MIIVLDRYVMREACRQLQDWRTRLPDMGQLSISVNLSVKQFARPDVADHIRAATREFGLDPAALRLEITESVLLESSPSATGQLEQLHEEGFRIYLDDFGTGYSSLSYLTHLTFDVLKMDKEFVDGVSVGSQKARVAGGIIDLGKSFDLDTVAEGVETTDQADALRALGCRFAQGYLFARPLAVADVEAFLTEAPVALPVT